MITLTGRCDPPGWLFLQSDVEDAAAAMRDEFESWAAPAFRLAPGHTPTAAAPANTPSATALAHAPSAAGPAEPPAATVGPTPSAATPDQRPAAHTPAHVEPPTSPTVSPLPASSLVWPPNPADLVGAPTSAHAQNPTSATSPATTPSAAPQNRPGVGLSTPVPDSRSGTAEGPSDNSSDVGGLLHRDLNGVVATDPASDRGESEEPGACGHRQGEGPRDGPSGSRRGALDGAGKLGEHEWAESGWLLDNPLVRLAVHGMSLCLLTCWVDGWVRVLQLVGYHDVLLCS
jgi:hypothetical protein